MAKAKKKRSATRKRATGKRSTAGRATKASERPKDDAWRKLVERAVLNSGGEPDKTKARGKAK